MSKNVFANGREVSGQADDNQSTCAMPDICLSPPSPPAGPIPIPYPNTAIASKTSDGSKTVKVGGQEVGLKNKSNYKESNGDEAATRSFGMGVVTHTIQGKMQHTAWSFDVKIEGENAIRHMDLTTHNHASDPPNIALTLNRAGMATPVTGNVTCKELDDMKPSVTERELEEGMVLPGQTMALGAYSNPGASIAGHIMKGVSHMSMVDDTYGNGFSKGKKWKKGAANLRACGNSGSTHNPAGCGHAEARMIEEVFSAAGRMGLPSGASLGSLTLNIEWKPSGGGTSNQPCGGCHNLICESMDCGLDIKICDKGKATEVNCP
jgi:hypothetical protein